MLLHPIFLGLTALFIACQILYFVGFLVTLYFFTRPINWVDVSEASSLAPTQYPKIILFYPVLKELEETMRSTFLGLAQVEYPRDKYRVVAIPNSNDTVTIESLRRLQVEFSFVEILAVPPTSDPSWNIVWQAWESNPKAYWWHRDKYAKDSNLPPKKTRQLIYAFYTLVNDYGDDWLLNYIDADSIPPRDHFLSGAVGIQKYDVLQSTNIAGNLLDTWAASWHAMDHMAWDGLIYPHLSANGKHPFWVLGKGLFFKASDLITTGGFNPWITIEDPEVGMRLWSNGKKIGMIAQPLIEEVPLTLKRGIIQRFRWVCGFFQALNKPLIYMGMPLKDRLLARLNLIPCLSLLTNVLGLPLGIWALAEFLLGTSPLSVVWVILSLVNIVAYVVLMTRIYISTWKRTSLVLKQRRKRLSYLFRVNPVFLWVYWLIWIVPIVIGFWMFLRDKGKVWLRTEKVDANHVLVRTAQVTPLPISLPVTPLPVSLPVTPLPQDSSIEQRVLPYYEEDAKTIKVSRKSDMEQRVLPYYEEDAKNNRDPLKRVFTHFDNQPLDLTGHLTPLPASLPVTPPPQDSNTEQRDIAYNEEDEITIRIPRKTVFTRFETEPLNQEKIE